jgi:hypothetical protein
MSFPNPIESGYTIYSKSDCSYCTKAKLLLADDNLTIYMCDSYLNTDKQEFLDFIKKITGKEQRNFPIIFKDSKYVGGYSDLLILLKELFSRD